MADRRRLIGDFVSGAIILTTLVWVLVYLYQVVL